MSATFPARRLSKAIVRQLRLPRDARVLHVGCGKGEVVGLLRRRKIDAFGLFDGPPLDRAENADIPELQPTTLHQSLPFMAQSFDAVVVNQTADYDGDLASPEACTATANLLAALKPGGQFVYCGTGDFAAMQQHLGEFPGKGSRMSLGSGGLLHLMLRLIGLAKPGLPALKYTVPHESISRLEWHRLARTAVANLSRPAATTDEFAADVADSPAA